jgi:hypothetical protein
MIANFIVGQIDWLLRMGETDEINRDDLTLMEKLEKRMLRVCARFAKVDFASAEVDNRSIPADRLSIGFHIYLLDVRSEFKHSLRIWRQCTRLVAEKIVVPNAQQTEQVRKVLTRRSAKEMVIQAATTREKPEQNKENKKKKKMSGDEDAASPL